MCAGNIHKNISTAKKMLFRILTGILIINDFSQFSSNVTIAPPNYICFFLSYILLNKKEYVLLHAQIRHIGPENH